MMDHSLLVEEKHEIVDGIIDYLRSYTWDKIRWHAKNLGTKPTIVHPAEYKIRFRSILDNLVALRGGPGLEKDDKDENFEKDEI